MNCIKLELRTHSNPSLSTKTEIKTLSNPYKKPELQICSAKNRPNPGPNLEKPNFKPFRTQVRLPKSNYKPTRTLHKSRTLNTYKLLIRSNTFCNCTIFPILEHNPLLGKLLCLGKECDDYRGWWISVYVYFPTSYVVGTYKGTSLSFLWAEESKKMQILVNSWHHLCIQVEPQNSKMILIMVNNLFLLDKKKNLFQK